MPKCNSRRCGFLHNPCFGSPSDCYCANRMTPKQCEKKMKELEITDIKELWTFIKNELEKNKK